MSTRPPTLREKRRYLLVRVEPPGTSLDPKDLYYAIADAATSLWGDATTAIIQPAVVAIEGGYVVIRCRRGTERELAISLSTVTVCGDIRIALRILTASGTIQSLREQMKNETPRSTDSNPLEECAFDGRSFLISHCSVQKVDVIEKGFKNTHRLFLTKEDLEDS